MAAAESTLELLSQLPGERAASRHYRGSIAEVLVDGTAPDDVRVRLRALRELVRRWMQEDLRRLPVLENPRPSASTSPSVMRAVAAGAVPEVNGLAYFALQRVAYLWSPGGYERAGPLKELGRVRVLTPPTTPRVLEAGYRPWVHPSVLRREVGHVIGLET